MRVTIYPSVPVGTVTAPPSKSMAHRLLICAGLVAGESRIRRIAASEDILATMDCLKALGAKIELREDTALVQGTDPAGVRSASLFCRESGSTLRFIIPLCLLSGGILKLEASPSLMRRPLSVYEKLAEKQKLRFERDGETLVVSGRLVPGEYTVEGGISSQFISGLLFALPLLDGDSRIRILPPMESRSYIDMTMDALNEFGVRTSWQNENTISVPGKQHYAAQDRTVEGDWSNAAFFLGMGVPVEGLKEDSLQGDRVCKDLFARLDKECAEIDISDCPDLGPVLFAYAALRHGGVFTGTRRLQLKESDRGRSMQEELKKFSVGTVVEENRITVGCGVHPPSEELDGHNDHRIVMALSLLCVRTGGTIRGAEAVRKSFPDYFSVMKKTGIRMETEHGMDLEK